MRLKAYRETSQVVFLALTLTGFIVGTKGIIYPYFFCYACPIDVGACPLGILEHGSIDIRLFGIWEGLAVLGYLVGFFVLLSALLGRAFCGWACPMGALQDVANKLGISKKVGKNVAPGGMDPRLRYVKYAILIMIPILAFFYLDLVYTRFCPIGGVTGTLMTLTIQPGQWAASTWFWVKIISIIFFGLIIVLAMRGWCRYLCPVGAALSPGNKITWLGIRRDEHKCTDCGLCERECPMRIKDMGLTPTSAECILCGRCTDACRTKGLEMRFDVPKGNIKPMLPVIGAILIAGSLFMVGAFAGGYNRVNDINAVPCLGCMALDPSGGSDFRPLVGTQPDFVSSVIPFKPVWLHYRTDVCSACDEMEPIIRDHPGCLQDEFGSRVAFVHINLDHANAAEGASYDLYDVKGSPSARTGVPMFVFIARQKTATGTQDVFATFYGVVKRQVLADQFNATLAMYTNPGLGPTESKVFTELFASQSCVNCPKSEDALVSLAAEGRTNFVVYVTDARGVSGRYAMYRQYSAGDALGETTRALPWAIFGGGPGNMLGADSQVKLAYEGDIGAVNLAKVNLSVQGGIWQKGNSLQLSANISNIDGSTQTLLVQGYLVEQVSHWLNDEGNPMPNTFVDMPINSTYSFAAKGSQNITVTWNGTDTLPYSSFRFGNLAMIIVVWKNGAEVTSTIVKPPFEEVVSFTNFDSTTLALPTGRDVVIPLSLHNDRSTPAALNITVEAPVNWTGKPSTPSLTVAAKGNMTFWLTANSIKSAAGDVAAFKVSVHGTTDPTLYAVIRPKIVVKNDITLPDIAANTFYPVEARATENVTVGVHVTDPAGLSSVKIAYYSCTASQCSIIFTKNMTDSGNGNFASNISAYTSEDIILHYKIIAEDTSGNVNATQMYDIVVHPVVVKVQEGSVPPVELGYGVMAVLFVIGAGMIAVGRMPKPERKPRRK